MKTLKPILALFAFIIIWGCQISPQKIDYGMDSCHFCRMTIVDKQHAAEVVTKKGKIYKFDATECMVNFIEDFNTSEIQLFLCNDFSNAEELIDATKATFLISENIPSPMGAYLSAFEEQDQAVSFQQDKGGELYTWTELLSHLK